MHRLFSFLVLVVFYCGSSATYGNEPSQTALPINAYRPRPEVISQSDSLASLITKAKPTFTLRHVMLTVSNKDKSPSFEYARAQLIKDGGSKNYWALLRFNGPATVIAETWLPAEELPNICFSQLPFVRTKIQRSVANGAGNYTRLIAANGDGRELYELGRQLSYTGSGGAKMEEKFYVLKSPGKGWVLVGEGLAESSQIIGRTFEIVNAVPTVSFTDNESEPVIVKIQSEHEYYDEEDRINDSPIVPRLKVQHDFILHGKLPTVVVSDGADCIVTDEGFTWSGLSREMARWIWPGNLISNAVDSVINKCLEDKNPKSYGNLMKPGTRIVLPSNDDFSKVMENEQNKKQQSI